MSDSEAHYIRVPWEVIKDVAGKMFFVVIDSKENLLLLAENIAEERGYGKPLRYRISKDEGVEFWYAKADLQTKRKHFAELINNRKIE